MRAMALGSVFILAALAGAAGIEVNGDFERGDNLGWTEWKSPWGSGFTFDYGVETDPYAGTYSFRQSAVEGSFGVYQEFCVEAGVAFEVSWAWKGATSGANGWWEVLAIDAPYSYEAADDPVNHPETTLLMKWAHGFGGPEPEPSATWVEDAGEIVPTSDVVTVVLKCGASPGPVEASFDNVVVTQASTLLELTAVAPESGGTAGGNPVTVSGRTLPPDGIVKFGGKDLLNPVRLSTCVITGNVPPGDPGAVDVTIASSRGTATLTGAYTYVAAPTIAAIAPNQGPTEGGTEVTITGTAFVDPLTATVGGAALADLVVVDATTITGKTPAGTAGPADVVVGTAAGQATLAGGFTYRVAPTIVTIVPNQGPTAGGTDVTITGAAFVDPLTATVGGAALVDLVVVDATTITGTTPAGTAGPADVVVETASGQATLAGGFTYSSSSTPAFKRGDCNGDASINIADAIAALSFLFGGAPEPPCLEACNGNDDAGVNIADAVTILGHLFGGAGPLMPPFGECGSDPTPTVTVCGEKQPGC